MASTKKHIWTDFINDSSTHAIKDETIDWDANEISSPQPNDIDYTIVNSKIDPFHPKNYHSIRTTSMEKPNVQNHHQIKKPVTVKRKSFFSGFSFTF